MMNKKISTKNEEIKRKANLVLIVSKELAILKNKGADPNNLWPLHPDKEVTDLFEDVKPIFMKVFEYIKKENGDQLSDEVILVKILYNVASLNMHFDLSDEDIIEKAQKALEDLLNYEAHRNVDVPLISLEIDGDPLEFGPILFTPISTEDKQSDWWNRARATLDNSADSLFLSYAKVSVPGDLHTSTIKSNELVNEGLLILRGICFPFETKDIHQFGIINDYPVWKNVPYRLGKPTETTIVDTDSRLVTYTGPFRTPYKIHKNLLSRIDPERFAKFLNLVEEDGFKSNIEIKNRIILGFRWLGEATKPDTLSARYAKIAFALESFIGGEANSKYLTTRGITATLAERAAFLLGNDLESRMKTDREIRIYYAKRSRIAHGKNQAICPDEFIKFGELIRKIGWALVERSDQLKTTDDIQKWANNQKYS